MDFYSMVKERLELSYPKEVNERAFLLIKELEELQKTKKKKSKIDEKILKPIVKAEKELWGVIGEFQKTFSIDLQLGENHFESTKFGGFISPWEFIGIEKKLFNYIRNHAELFQEKERKFPCNKCWNDSEEVTTYFLSAYDDQVNRVKVDWFRGVAKRRKYFKNGIYIYICKSCGKWYISSKIYNPHG